MLPFFTLFLWISCAFLLFGPLVRILTKRRFADDPSLSRERLKAYANLAVAFTLIIATQWLAQPIRGAVFQRHVSPQEEAKAKEYSTIFMIPVVLVYSAVATVLDDQKSLIKWVCWFYGVCFICAAVYLVLLDLYEMHDSDGGSAVEPSSSPPLSSASGGERGPSSSSGRSSPLPDFLFARAPKRFLIYALYIIIDTKSGIGLSMVWSCVHLYFRGAKSVAGGPATTADTVYPYLNFWCQVFLFETASFLILFLHPKFYPFPHSHTLMNRLVHEPNTTLRMTECANARSLF